VRHPELTRIDAAEPRAVVLLLHGGTVTSERSVDARSASWRRMAALQRAIAPALLGAGASSWLLRYRTRGWDGGERKVADARWALEEVRRGLGDVPVVLLGHSMGARTAARVADDPHARGLVALAPWFPPEDPTFAGTTLRAAHGRRDRITSYAATRAYVARASAAGADASLLSMGWAGHYLLSRVGRWNAFALEQSLALLAPEPVVQTT
jgi:pimeloyl-ACP methyl ester carboxylesterase